MSAERLGVRIPYPVRLRAAQGPAIPKRECPLVGRRFTPGRNVLQIVAGRMNQIQLAGCAPEQLRPETLHGRISFGRRQTRLEIAAEFAEVYVLTENSLQFADSVRQSITTTLRQDFFRAFA